MDEVLAAYSKAWAAGRSDLARWLKSRNAADNARWQSSMRDTLRNLLPIEDGFAKDRIANAAILRVRKELSTIDRIGPDLAFAQATNAWASEAGRTATLVEDVTRLRVRDEKLANLPGPNWTWKARLDRKTCPYCFAMHGRSFPIGVPMVSHPNCRCLPVSQPLGSGWSWLRRQSASTQDAVLGRMVGLAWRRGGLRQEDIIDFGKHKRRSLRSIFGARAMKAYRRRAGRG